MLLQLKPSIPVDTPKGRGECVGWIDYSKEDDLMWIVLLDVGGECWIFPNKDVRGVPNFTIGRRVND